MSKCQKKWEMLPCTDRWEITHNLREGNPQEIFELFQPLLHQHMYTLFSCISELIHLIVCWCISASSLLLRLYEWDVPMPKNGSLREIIRTRRVSTQHYLFPNYFLFLCWASFRAEHSRIENFRGAIHGSATRLELSHSRVDWWTWKEQKQICLKICYSTLL